MLTPPRRPPRGPLHLLVFLLALSYLDLTPTEGLNWQENLRPKLFAAMTSRDYTSFPGNLSARDTFSTLLYTEVAPSGGGSDNEPVLLVGAKNIVYKLSASELRLKQTLIWHATDFDRDACSVKGQAKEICQNYIVLLQQYSEDPSRYMVCGTHAFKPMCRDYLDERGSYVMQDEKSGLGLAPFDPAHNSTAVLVGEDLFSGTVADIPGVDPIIFREPVRTKQYDSVVLNSPNFVGSFAHEDHVYFFFREVAVEHINCGKSIFSRVARVCKNDVGGPNKFKHSWTSFFKTRLNCSIPGDFPFYFDEIQGISKPVRGQYGDRVDEDVIVYATFSTPVNSIGGSAVCAFRIRDVAAAFAGKFKEQRSSGANWLSVDDHKVPSPRPGICTNDSKTIPSENLNFVRTHSLMDEPVSPFFGSPLVVRTGLISRFTVIAVDPQVKTTEGKAYDVIFIGTTTGRVLKVINAQSTNSTTDVSTVIIEELAVFAAGTKVKQVQLIGGGGDGRKSLSQLAVMSETELRSIPVQRCDRASTCQECVALQDPYCAWEIRSNRCSSGDWTKNMAASFIQAISLGNHAHCPAPVNPASSAVSVSQVFAYEKFLGGAKLGQVVNIIDESHISGAEDGDDSGNDGNVAGGNGVKILDASQVLFSLETLIITVSAGAVAALVLGFVTGYCCGRKCRKEDGHHGGHPYPDTEYEYFEQRGGLARPMTMGPGPGAPLLPSQQSSKLSDGRHLHEEVTYAEPELVTGPMRPGGLGPSPHMTLMGGAPGGMMHTGGPPPPQTGMVNPSARYQGMQPSPLGSLGPQPGGSHYSSSLLNPANKFNTIHSGSKRPLPSINQYESAAEARLGSGKDPAYYARGRDNLNSYHMSTLGRSSSMRNKADPLLAHRSISGGGGAGGGGGGGGVGNGVELSGSNGTTSSESSGGGGGGLSDRPKGQQVVDSAYGTTRSVKSKVYL